MITCLSGCSSFDGIPPARRYEQEVRVVFRIDANGILNVVAEVLATGKRQELTVTEAVGLTEDEVVGRMLEANRFESEDENRKRIAEACNKVRAVLYALKQSMAEMGGELYGDEKSRLRKLLGKLREDLSCRDVDEVTIDLDCLKEFMDRAKARIKNVRLVRMLASSVERNLGDQMAPDEREMLEATIAGLDGVRPEEVEAEINKLRELLVLSKTGFGGG